MTKHLYLFVFFFCCFCGIGQQSQLLDICSNRDSSAYTIVDVEDLFLERWDTLAQPIFWKKIMKLSPDTCIINIAASREILCYEPTELWSGQSSDQKQAYKDSLKLLYCLDDETKIYVTSGKKDFYLVNKTMPSISKAVNVFDACKVDPWYAQAILLIESPKKLEYSNAGAYGPFQLMKSVARAHGLVVNKTTDERKDFEKVKHVLRSYGKAIELIGPSGSGQIAKMINQICIAGLVQGLSEGMAFGKKANVDMEKVLSVISKGAAQSWQMENRYRTMLDSKFDYGFAVDWMRKDLSICFNEAKKNGASLPVTEIVDKYYEKVQKNGGNRLDTSSLMTLLDK